MAKILFKGHTAQHIREAELRESLDFFWTQTDELIIKKEKGKKDRMESSHSHSAKAPSYWTLVFCANKNRNRRQNAIKSLSH